MLNYVSKNTQFYLDSVAEVHLFYDKLLFNAHKKRNSSLIYIADYTEFNILQKSIITLNVLVNDKSEVVNFCNVLHIPELKYNLLLIDTIKKPVI